LFYLKVSAMLKAPRALFLDRDGVINNDAHFVYRKQDCHFVPGIFELSRKAAANGYRIIVVTNQSGIGRGLFSESQFLEFMEWMRGRFTEEGVTLTEVYYCPYHPTEAIGHFKRPSLDRKPSPGMFLKARDKFKLNMNASIAIGDSPRDAQAAHAAGVGTILHLAGKSKPAEATAEIASLSEALAYFTS